MTLSKSGTAIGSDYNLRVKVDENLVVKSNKIEQISFVHPEFLHHKC